MSLTADVQTLEPGAWIELYTLDSSALGGSVVHFHGYTQIGPIWWQGVEYTAFPIETEGFELTSDSSQPIPRLRVGNVSGAISALCIAYQDLLGSILTRHRTLGKYLDAANFPAGNPTADPTQERPPDIWYIERKSSEDSEIVEFELAGGASTQGQQLPRRQIVCNQCSWVFKSPECGYVGAATTCDKKFATCQALFGANNPLPFGGFPAASLTGI